MASEAFFSLPEADPMSSLPLIAQAGNRARNLFFDVEGSTLAGDIDNVFYFILWVSIVSFVAIVAVTGWFLLKYRARPGHEAVKTATHSTSLEITWTVIPTILSAAMFWVGFEGYMDLKQAPSNAYEIQVRAFQWGWEFSYPNGAKDTDLHIPAETPVKLVMTSSDVLHSLFIPAFRVKQDVVPGRYTSMWFESLSLADLDGGVREQARTLADTGYVELNLFCTEYCGTNHSGMGRTVYVYTPADFEAKITEIAKFMIDPAIPLAEKGARVYAGACNSCHLVEEDAVKIGPSFYNLSRSIRDGEMIEFTDAEDASLVPDENYIRESILYPGEKVRKGYPNQMNSFLGNLDDRRIEALIAYIKSLSTAEAAN